MTNVELVLNMLAEVSTKEIVKEKIPFVLNENIEIAQQGGNIAKNARIDLENKKSCTYYWSDFWYRKRNRKTIISKWC